MLFKFMSLELNKLIFIWIYVLYFFYEEKVSNRVKPF